MIDFTPYIQSDWSWIILFVAALFVGMSKTGVPHIHYYRYHYQRPCDATGIISTNLHFFTSDKQSVTISLDTRHIALQRCDVGIGCEIPCAVITKGDIHSSCLSRYGVASSIGDALCERPKVERSPPSELPVLLTLG